MIQSKVCLLLASCANNKTSNRTLTAQAQSISINTLSLQSIIMASTKFTHIVVGAGSAGCVIAARIAENKDSHVLLIEAGPDQDALDSSASKIRESKRVPMHGQSELFDPKIDWNLQVDLSDSTMRVPQAKLVGGGSSINGGTALRNTEADSRLSLIHI